MGSTEPDNLYLSYYDYHKLKSYFYSDREFDYNEGIYNTVLKSLKIPQYRESDYKKVLLKLMKYFSGDVAFYNYGFNESCMYINYKLNKELITLFYKVNDSIFEIFQDFAEKHDKEKRTPKCASKLYYTDYTKFHQLQHLYDLYDQLKHISTMSNNELFCSKLTNIVRKYNLNIDDYYDKDKNLFNKLLKYKELVEKLEFLSNSTCQVEIKKFITPAQYLLDQEELSRKQKLEEESQRQSHFEPSVSLPTIESIQLEGESLDKRESEFSKDNEFIAPPEQTKDSVVLKYESGLEDEKETGDLVTERITDTSETHKSLKLPEEPSYQTGYVRAPFIPEKLDNQTEEVHGSYILEKTTSDGEGIIKTLQSTFSTIVENVEPAPVLGVSGGMGALYLLLRYTPIGSFFGGRRGRNNRIPSGFPGAYPGFPEYYDGNFGNIPFHISYQAE